MALHPSTLEGRFIKFESVGIPPDTGALVSFSGREAISRLYRFDVELLSDRADLDLVDVLQKPAYIGIKQGVPMTGSTRQGILNLRIHGMVSSFEQGGRVEEWVGYRAILVPRLWRLTLNVRSRIFQDKNVIQIVEEILKDHGFTADDYEFKTAASYPKHEYVVQYQESDFDFLCRQLEHVGVFFYFVHGDDREKVVFGDSASQYEVLANPSVLPYRPAGAAGDRNEAREWLDPEGIHAITARSNLIPAEVVLRDYNWRTPSTDLKVSSAVTPEGVGTVYEYGDHYKDSAEGKALAQVRAEELKCRQTLFTGSSDCRAFRAGTSWEFTDHYRADFNQEYLVTAVNHKGTQSIVLGGRSGGATATYENDFTCIPANLVFRPLRVTPRPRIQGAINARVDASGSGEYAEIDDHGRYKVQIPFDLSGKSGGQASRFLRMAQPYAGANMGMHFPLHKGTEVAILHANGDPDRPFIAGAIPNPETASPVIGGNQTQCVLRTGGDNKLVIDDDVGRITLSTPTARTQLRLGEHSSPGVGVWLTTDGHMNANVQQDVGWTIAGRLAKTIDKDYDQFILGKKIIFIGGAKAETIVGSDTKLNVANKNEICLAVGLKIGKGTMYKIGSVQEKVLIPVLKQKIADVEAHYGKWRTQVDGPWWTKSKKATFKTEEVKWDAAADWTLKAKGTISQKAPKVETKVDKAEVIAGHTLKLKGGSFLIKVAGSEAKIGNKLKVSN